MTKKELIESLERLRRDKLCYYSPIPYDEPEKECSCESYNKPDSFVVVSNAYCMGCFELKFVNSLLKNMTDEEFEDISDRALPETVGIEDVRSAVQEMADRFAESLFEVILKEAQKGEEE